ncbi:flagellar basal body rod protein FlgB [Marinobacterium nitratireducens]|uniref:Flagellar basal body rod protein FlgB n=1 Tax=Marinobacterium nitratireducens TaxID=518897 RepID=A0A918DWH5_9GAMM|nr:flagellar basal body rod protein FlgB [Marinobacterium nitratireducens]GGO84894.1 flagellar basal body rod protein FlgB [Marinobacterium nitratireducens]
MSISFDNALGIHAEATLLRARRAEVLANNIANADTPGFKARDIDFAAILKGEQSAGPALPLQTTSAGHQQPLVDPSLAADLLFRTPTQPSVDGNTVEIQQEMARYTENALDYQASFDFLNRKFNGLSKALKGE